MNKEGDLKVWHNSNFGNPAFKQTVKSIDEAKRMLLVLARYDMYKSEDEVPMNAQGLEVFEDGEWCEWLDYNYCTINEID